MTNNLYQAIWSTKAVDEKRLRIDIAQIQEAVSKERVEVNWVPAGKMLADCLTKRGMNAEELMNVLKTGRLPDREEDREKVG